ncbi:hypothetical protein E5988_15100 [Sphingomonas olei]|uniref:Transposase DDE domain-containing protein n=1 Tax=Sphingomonas olei TaxID=1886787 RepID=A0ABY2QEW0_9SPHN|nr:hypothetical protein E5988_15100 [Sphingomonas olei]
MAGLCGFTLIYPATAAVAPYPLRSTPDCAGNLVERLWCRLKDWRRVATRYDKLAADFLSGALIAALIT